MTLPRRAEPDVYAVLGARRSDSWQELRRRYRARARELHPDVQVHRQGHQRLEESRATRMFSQLQAAWALVDSPERRAQYDLEHPEALRPVPRPPRVPSWPGGPAAGVLLRSGPGDLHIAVPGAEWDLSLAQFAARVGQGRAPRLLVGDLPPHPEVRSALAGIPFAERSRMAAMVGLEVAFDERAEEQGEDREGLWKLEQVRRCVVTWSRSLGSPHDRIPYREDLLQMGRLSLAGYELNLPHPAGLTLASEPRARGRAEAQERRLSPMGELLVPAPTLLLAGLWSDDGEFAAAVAGGWLNPSRGGSAPLLRALAARRARSDHHEALWGSVLDAPPAGGALAELGRFPRLWAWLGERRVPAALPWGEPSSECGRDRRLSDAGARLMARVLRRLEGTGATLVLLRGNRVGLRLPKGGATALLARCRAEAEAELERCLGMSVPVETR